MSPIFISRRTFFTGLAATAVAATLVSCSKSTTGSSSDSKDSSDGARRMSDPEVNYTPDFSAGPTIFPQPGARTAQAHSQITFRGLTQEDIEKSLVITGSESGDHSEGSWIKHSDGYGVSFQPKNIFAEGETVTVSVPDINFQNADGDPTFTVGTQVHVDTVDTIDSLAGVTKNGIIHYTSNPDLATSPLKLLSGKSQLSSDTKILPTSQGKRGFGIYDHTGELQYWHPSQTDVWNVAHLETVKIDDQTVLTWYEGNFDPTTHYSRGTEYFLDGSYQDFSTGFTVGNGYEQDLHEFHVTNHNSVFITIYNPVKCDLSDAGGNTDVTLVDGIIQEVDLTTGAVLFEWHAVDNVAFGESFTNLNSGTKTWDWVHLNSAMENADGEILISSRDTNSLMLLNHESGKRIWKLGGATAQEISGDATLMDGVKTFTMGEGTYFSAQHHGCIWSDGRISVYDNEDDADKRRAADYEYSRGLVFDVDYDNYTVKMYQEFIHPDKVMSATQGSVVRLDDGGAFISWGNSRVISEFDQDTKMVASWELAATYATYRAELTENWTGTPTDTPSAAYSDGTVYVSWNGATEVASWQVQSDGKTIATADLGGFETAIDISDSNADVVTLNALDADGTVLGTSNSVNCA